MKHSAEMRRCLIDCDVEQVRRLFKHISPHLPQPQSDHEALAAIHFSRTQMASIPFKLRAYSHRWLGDQGYPSALPDHLKPKAERIYPKIVEGVGIACLARSELYKPIVGSMQGAMEDAVHECYADGKTEPTFVKSRMYTAKAKVVEKLLGIFKSRSFMSMHRNG